MGIDSFGDRMKSYEATETQRVSVAGLPLMARIDGRGFSRFTKGLDKPYDIRMTKCMYHTAKNIAKETHAICSYVQSDEITLLYYPEHAEQQLFFGGKFFKLTSVLSSMATAYFTRQIMKRLPKIYFNKMPTFDCRVWNVPNVTEATNAFLWREQDATKNSIQSLARKYFSTKQLHKKNCKHMQELLLEQGIEWEDYPDFFKRGVFIQRKLYFAGDPAEPRYTYERARNMPAFKDVVNRDLFIFKGMAPIYEPYI